MFRPQFTGGPQTFPTREIINMWDLLIFVNYNLLHKGVIIISHYSSMISN